MERVHRTLAVRFHEFCEAFGHFFLGLLKRRPTRARGLTEMRSEVARERIRHDEVAVG